MFLLLDGEQYSDLSTQKELTNYSQAKTLCKDECQFAYFLTDEYQIP